MKKLILVVALGALFLFSASAQTVNLYRDVNSESSVCNHLVDLYRNQLDYDPYTDYIVCSDSRYSYCLYYGDLDGRYNYILYTQAHDLVPASYSYGSGNNLVLVDNGFSYVGNVPGSMSSERSENYKFLFVVPIVLIIILVLIAFKIHKRANLAPVKGYTIR